MICWRRRSRAFGWAGLYTRGLMMAPARSAASSTAEVRRGLAEVAPRGGLGAPDAVAPFDDVQVELEDPDLGQLRFEPARDHQLRELALRAVRRRQVEVLRELLRDGRGAARGHAAADAVFERHAQLVEVEAVVLPERGVLRHDHGALERGRDAVVAHPSPRRPPRLAAGGGLARAQVHERRRAGILLLERSHVRQPDPAVRDQRGDTATSASAARTIRALLIVTARFKLAGHLAQVNLECVARMGGAAGLQAGPRGPEGPHLHILQRALSLRPGRWRRPCERYRGIASGKVSASPVDVVLDKDRGVIVQPDIVYLANDRLRLVRGQVWGAPNATCSHDTDL